MGYHSGADHIEIDINKAADQVYISFNSCSMITVFSERTLPFFALIEFLSGSPGAQLNAFWDDIRPAINHQQMIVIGGDHIVEYSQAKTLLGLEEP